MSAPEEIDYAAMLKDVDVNVTVEEFLRKRCADQIAQVRAHGEALIEKFQQEAEKVYLHLYRLLTIFQVTAKLQSST